MGHVARNNLVSIADAGKVQRVSIYLASSLNS